MISTEWVAPLVFLGLFAGILISLEAGYRVGRRSSKRNPERGFEGVGAMEAAVFSLLGLLLAFSFSGATSRFDTRRQLIVQEANAIATAYQRLDLAPTMSGVLAGHAMARRPRRSWLHMLLISAIISLTITVMFDFNYPRYGVIRIDAADRVFLQLRESM
jgi:hypothetical protein